jgi:hypothetical protein
MQARNMIAKRRVGDAVSYAQSITVLLVRNHEAAWGKNIPPHWQRNGLLVSDEWSIGRWGWDERAWGRR